MLQRLTELLRKVRVGGTKLQLMVRKLNRKPLRRILMLQKVKRKINKTKWN